MKAIALLVMVSAAAVVLVGQPASAQDAGQVSPASPTCASSFFSALVQLMPCRPAVTPFSPAPPSDACCNALKALGQPCLCVLLNGPPLTGIDRNMALQLPGMCTINFEPCNLV